MLRRAPVAPHAVLRVIARQTGQSPDNTAPRHVPGAPRPPPVARASVGSERSAPGLAGNGRPRVRAVTARARLAAAGVESLKVVGREASLERKEASVRLVAHALRLANAGGGPEVIRDATVALRGARGLCEGARLCYYPDVWASERRRRRAC